MVQTKYEAFFSSLLKQSSLVFFPFRRKKKNAGGNEKSVGSYIVRVYVCASVRIRGRIRCVCLFSHPTPSLWCRKSVNSGETGPFSRASLLFAIISFRDRIPPELLSDLPRAVIQLVAIV